ncbi:HDOD domain-containing protein [Pseudoxanthomonas sp. 10H]|uniref:HDOD domain-containing protein n=1 Tax=Pseudoxanthomonas sp. 10H TaxID=3242729 RepID=UPI0035565C59
MALSGGLGLLALAALVGACAWFWRARPPRAPASQGARPSPVPPAGADGHAAGDLDDWTAPLFDPAPDRPAAAAGDATAVEDAERRLARFASEPGRLPRRPQLLPQLLGTLNDEDASGREISALIARDPALAATLLKLANSPLYRLQQAPVESVERAVTLVGTEGLRRLVAVALMQPVMRTEGGVFGDLPGRIWDQTQRATVAAARGAAGEGVDAFAAQLLVLLHGLGAIVVVQALREACERTGRPPPATGDSAGLLRRWSPRIGRLVADQWHLSPALLQALDDPGKERAAGTPLARVLAASLAEASRTMRVDAGTTVAG